MKRLIVGCLLLAGIGISLEAQDPRIAIRAVLNRQVEAWNRGDLEVFMQGYWKSPELTFFSGGSRSQGWRNTMKRYMRRYRSGGKKMGQLRFSDVNVVMLGPAAALVRGRYHLSFADGRHPEGLFTLVFRQFVEGWRIVHDHTSSKS